MGRDELIVDALDGAWYCMVEEYDPATRKGTLSYAFHANKVATIEFDLSRLHPSTLKKADALMDDKKVA